MSDNPNIRRNQYYEYNLLSIVLMCGYITLKRHFGPYVATISGKVSLHAVYSFFHFLLFKRLCADVNIGFVFKRIKCSDSKVMDVSGQDLYPLFFPF